MKFGSWTYDGYRVDVIMESDEGDTKKYVPNGEWDLIGISAQRNEIIYVCCPQPYPDVTYTVHIRRRTKYYYVNLIIPCVLITCKSFNHCSANARVISPNTNIRRCQGSLSAKIVL